MNKMEIGSESFEQSLQNLENIVKKMESGTLPLEEALSSFQEGIGLVKKCQHLLSQAEQKVEILTKANADSIESKKFEIE